MREGPELPASSASLSSLPVVRVLMWGGLSGRRVPPPSLQQERFAMLSALRPRSARLSWKA
eukprot:454198-Alexandrium_andersonii.AAC.1